jgi:hypothetical protein
MASAASTLEAYRALIGLGAIPRLWTAAQIPAGSEHASDLVGVVSRGVVTVLGGVDGPAIAAVRLRVDVEERVEPPHPPSSTHAAATSSIAVRYAVGAADSTRGLP